MDYSFLHRYKMAFQPIEEEKVESIGNLPHCFFALPGFQIREALNTFDPFPEELKAFYYEIGFGFMNRTESGRVNTLFDPMTLIYINKQVSYFATSEIATELKYCDIEKQLLFFKTASNQYLSIDKQTVNGNNAIYYRGEPVEKSLYDFLEHFDFNHYQLNQQIDSIDSKQEMTKQKVETSQKEEKTLRELYDVKDNEMLVVEGHYWIED